MSAIYRKLEGLCRGGIEECEYASQSVWELYCATITAEWALNLAVRFGSEAERRAACARHDTAHAAWRAAFEALAAAPDQTPGAGGAKLLSVA